MGKQITKVKGLELEEVADSRDTIRFRFDKNKYAEISFFGDYIEVRTMNMAGDGTMQIRPDCANKVLIKVL